MKNQLLILCVLVISSCQRHEKPIYYENIPKQQIEYRDSLFILYTLKTLYENDWNTFRDDSRFYKIDTTTIRYSISRIFYSPDKKRMLAWVVKKSPNGPSLKSYSSDPKNNYLCPGSGNVTYDLNVLIGFREVTNETWKIYPLDNEGAVCCSSIDKALNPLQKYYFLEMKNHSEYVNKKYLDKNYGGDVRYDLEKETIEDGYGDKDSPFILKNYGYNLEDKDFWAKSLIWQKGARIPGLYDFQTQGNVTPDDKDAELIVPKITYPDSILRMFK